jgi:N-acyl-D-amino-acid deacylase
MTSGLVVDDALVADGSGGGAFRGFVVVEGDRIGHVGRAPGAAPAEVGVRRLDAGGRVLCPGFIDVHNHSDVVPFVEPTMDSALRQGCTTLIVGNCGSSAWPPAGGPELAILTGVAPTDLEPWWPTFAKYLDAVERARPAVNIASLVGHGALRLEAMGSERRPPTPDELARMRGMTREAMEAGALGLSTGLVYVPGMYADEDEIAELAAEARPYGGLYASHIRGEGGALFDAVDEALDIGRRGGVGTHVSHLKCESELTWGRAPELLSRIGSAAHASADQYPYTAWASVLSSLLPEWAPVADLAAIAGDADRRATLASVVERGEPGWQSSVLGVGWDRIVVESTSDASSNGRSIADVAAERGAEPVDAMFDLLIDDPDTAVIGHAMSEVDVRTILADPSVMVASDSSAMSPSGPLRDVPVHPRTYGTFPRVLGRYCRDDAVVPLELAIAKMTSLPADRFGLAGRGRIVDGAVADLVLLDPAQVNDEAEFGAPHRFPRGIDVVVVNGTVAWDGERVRRAGRALRRA